MLQPPGGNRPRTVPTNRRKTQESPDEIVRRLQRLPANKKCCDCSSKLPSCVILTIGSFVCLTCAGIHREMNARVKGVGHSSFTAEEADFLQATDNEKINAIYLATFDQRSERLKQPMDNSDQHLLRTWIQRKYRERSWYSESNGGQLQQQSNNPQPTVAQIPPKNVPAVDLFGGFEDNSKTVHPQQNTWDAFGSQSNQGQQQQKTGFANADNQQHAPTKYQNDPFPTDFGSSQLKQQTHQQSQQQGQPVFQPDFGDSLQQPPQQQHGFANFNANFDQQSVQVQNQQPVQSVGFANLNQSHGAAHHASQQPFQAAQLPNGHMLPQAPHNSPQPFLPANQQPMQQSVQAPVNTSGFSVSPPKPPESTQGQFYNQHNQNTANLGGQRQSGIEHAHVATQQQSQQPMFPPTGTSQHQQPSQEAHHHGFGSYTNSVQAIHQQQLQQMQFNGFSNGANQQSVAYPPGTVAGGFIPNQLQTAAPLVPATMPQQQSQWTQPTEKVGSFGSHSNKTVDPIQHTPSSQLQQAQGLSQQQGPTLDIHKIEHLENPITPCQQVTEKQKSIDEAFSHLSVSEQKDTAQLTPPNGTNKVSKFKQGQKVYYKSASYVGPAKILKVHLDDELQPFYTIAVDGKERQTDDGHLEDESPLLSEMKALIAELTDEQLLRVKQFVTMQLQGNVDTRPVAGVNSGTVPPIQQGYNGAPGVTGTTGGIQSSASTLSQGFNVAYAQSLPMPLTQDDNNAVTQYPMVQGLPNHSHQQSPSIQSQGYQPAPSQSSIQPQPANASVHQAVTHTQHQPGSLGMVSRQTDMGHTLPVLPGSHQVRIPSDMISQNAGIQPQNYSASHSVVPQTHGQLAMPQISPTFGNAPPLQTHQLQMQQPYQQAPSPKGNPFDMY